MVFGMDVVSCMCCPLRTYTDLVHLKHANKLTLLCPPCLCCVCLLQLPRSDSLGSISTADSLKVLGDLAYKVLSEVPVMRSWFACVVCCISMGHW